MKRLWIVFALFIAFAPVVAKAQVVVSEVAWAGSEVSTADEWFELWNTGSEPVSLEGWRVEGAATSGGAIQFSSGATISASGTYLVANYAETDAKSTLAAKPDLVTTAVSLPNDKLHLVLFDNAGTTIDEVGTTNAAPFAGQSGAIKSSMERAVPIGPGYLKASWRGAEDRIGFDSNATGLGTPSTPPTLTALPPETTPTTNVVVDTGATTESNPTAVKLSELMPAPRKGESEWIETTNPSSVGELLDGWTIENGRGEVARLSGLIQPWERVVITNLWSNLRNAGDIVVLKDAKGRVIDKVAYGGWERGVYVSVTGTLKTGETVARLELSDKWAITSVPTPNVANVFPVEVDEPLTEFKIATTASATGSPVIKGEDVSSSASNTPKVTAKKKTVKPVTIPKLKPGERRYDGEVTIPTGVYGKTRLYAVVNGALREIRLTRTPTKPPQSGEAINFIGQEKSDADKKWLSVPIASLVADSEPSTPTFSATSSWPNEIAAVELTGTVTKIESGKLWIQAGEKTGAVILPTATKVTSKVGDIVVARGWASATEEPVLYLTSLDGVALVKPASATTTATSDKKKLSGALSGGITASVGGVGLLAYLRNEKLKRQTSETPSYNKV